MTNKCNSKGKNKISVLDDEGNEVELACSGETAEEGSDVILLKKGKGKPDEVVGSVNPDDIDTRIDNLKGGASEARKAQLDELRAKRDAAKEERLEKLEEKTTGPNKEKVAGARKKGKGSGVSSSSGSSDGTPSPTTTSGNGNSNSGRGGGNSSSGGDNSGGGNSGGGGTPETPAEAAQRLRRPHSPARPLAAASPAVAIPVAVTPPASSKLTAPAGGSTAFGPLE